MCCGIKVFLFLRLKGQAITRCMYSWKASMVVPYCFASLGRLTKEWSCHFPLMAILNIKLLS